jgi:nuclear GTP-binding protein
MERVKPLYLSKTYGMPLPNKDDPTQGWDPEEFLDTLARKKGRLLKHGEPDLDSVAKIILSDWVRGRIPFFVPPPERPEDLNIAEAKARAKAARDVKGKGKAVEEPEVPGVKQNLGSIMQKNTFLPEDIQPLEEATGDAGIEEENSDGDSDAASKDGSDEEEEELQWTDVFEGIKKKDDIPSALPEESADEEEDGSSENGMLLSCFLSDGRLKTASH